jgi:hypothetical protein
MGIPTTTLFRPPREAQQKGHRSVTTPPDAREDRIPPPAQHFTASHWKRERVQRLCRIFHCIERGQSRGKTIRKMLVGHAWRWKGRHYKSSPERPIRFTRGTLLRLFYQWQNGGKTPESLTLRYRCGNQKASSGRVVELMRLCLVPGTMSFSVAYRRLQEPGATESAYRYATPSPLRAAVAELLAHRRHEQVLQRKVKRYLEGPSK